MAPPPFRLAPDARAPRLAVFDCDADEAELFHRLAGDHGVDVRTTGDPLSAGLDVPTGTRCVSVAHTSKVAARTLRAVRAVGVERLITRSVGVDHVDLDAAHEVGVTVDNVTYSPDGVADFTVMLVLMALRHATRAAEAGSPDSCVRARDLRDLTVGVLGAGSIGRAVIARLHGFGCNVLACTNRPTTGLDVALVDLDELLARSDVVSLHVPLTAGTRHLIGPEQLASMRRDAVLINTARGAVVDTDALVVALEDGRLGGAALDVVDGDDALLDRLRRQPNVTLTPHVAYRTVRTLHETVAATLTTCTTHERNHTDDQADDRDPVRRMLGGA